MKILLTGAAGFIGSHVAEFLVARGDTVIGFDNLNDFYPPQIKQRNLEPLVGNGRFRLAVADLEDEAAVANVFAAEDLDAVVHLAARAGVRPSLERPLLYERTNGLGTLHLLEAARRHGCSKLVLASSSSVYGNGSRLPFSEDDPADAPISPYAATKRANELMARTYALAHGLDIGCLRFFTVYGPRQRPEMAIARFIRQIEAGEPIPFHGDGSSRRDYTYIDDIVRGTVAALDRVVAHRGFEIWNLGGHRTTTLDELVSLIEEAVGRRAVRNHLPDQMGDVTATYADISKARRMLGWEPTLSPADGIPRQVAWWRSVARK